MAKKLDIDWPELQFALDSGFGEASCYLDRETGTVVTVTEDIRAAADEEDEAGGLIHSFWRRCAPSTAAQSATSRSLTRTAAKINRDIAEFIGTVRDRRLAELLEVAIAGHGAFRRFKDVLSDSPAERERWFAWQDSRQHERILDWVAAEGIAPGNAPAAPVAPPPAEPQVKRRLSSSKS